MSKNAKNIWVLLLIGYIVGKKVDFYAQINILGTSQGRYYFLSGVTYILI